VLRIVTKDNNPQKDNMTTVIVEDALATLGDFKLRDINLSVTSGEFFVILGPSGAGKSVLLDLIAGFILPRRGRVLLDNVDVTYLPTEKRHLGYMFQRNALFPNMSVYENVKFGLRYAGLPNHQRRTEDMMDLMGEELRDAVNQFEITALFVTHDQTEARLLADRLGVMCEGQLIQTGSVHQVFDKPRDKRVAAFVGMENIFEGTVVSQDGGIIVADIGKATIEAVADNRKGERVLLGIRPENVTIMREQAVSSARNTFTGTIRQILNLGPINKVIIDCGFVLSVYVTNTSTETLGLEKGIEVGVAFKATGVYVIRKERQSKAASG